MTVPYVGDPDKDPFRTTNSGRYDKDKIYTNSTDGRGHYDDLRMKVPQGMPAQMSELVRLCPEFKSNADFVRNAIVHAMHKWGEVAKNREVGEYVDRLTRLEDMERLEKAVEENTSLFNKTKDILESAIARKDGRTIGLALDRAEDCLEVLEEPWEGDLKRLIEWVKGQIS